MAQKDKDLLLKDLCARLPYKVKFKYEDRPEVCGILSITPIYENGNVVYFDRYVNEPKKCSIYDVKPYLFPMTSMTREEVKELIREVISEELKIDIKKEYYRHLYTHDYYNVQLKLGDDKIISTSKNSIKTPRK